MVDLGCVLESVVYAIVIVFSLFDRQHCVEYSILYPITYKQSFNLLLKGK